MKINSKIIFKNFLLLTFFSLCFSFSALASNAQQNSQTYKYFYIKPKNIIDFVKEINELGKKGYQLKSVERYTRFAKNEDYYDVNIAGIVELHAGDYFEYDWIKFINLNELTENISLLGNRGFYFSQQIPYSLLPEDDNAEPGSLKKSVQIIADNYAPNEKDGNLFILERKNKLDEPIEFTFATPKPRTSIFGTSVTTKRTIGDIEQSVNEVDTRVFKPVAAFYSSHTFKSLVPSLETVLFQNNFVETFNPKPDYQMIARFASLVRTYKRDISELSNQGYNLTATSYNLALLTQTNKKVNYTWFDAESKNLFKNLEKTIKSGGRYVGTQSDIDFTVDLVFETPLTDDGKRFEYKGIKLTKISKYVKMQNGERELLIENSKTAKEEMQELVNQGYTMKTIYYANDGMAVLFEKQVN